MKKPRIRCLGFLKNLNWMCAVNMRFEKNKVALTYSLGAQPKGVYKSFVLAKAALILATRSS